MLLIWGSALVAAAPPSLPLQQPRPDSVSNQATPQASLLIQSSPLAGSQYHALAEVVAQIHIGDALMLKREPTNLHDPNAVQVIWHNQLLGFVPRRENRAVARALDQGIPLFAQVVALRPQEAPWQRLRFEISMPLSTPSSTVNQTRESNGKSTP